MQGSSLCESRTNEEEALLASLARLDTRAAAMRFSGGLVIKGSGGRIESPRDASVLGSGRQQSAQRATAMCQSAQVRLIARLPCHHDDHPVTVFRYRSLDNNCLLFGAERDANFTMCRYP